MHKGTIISVGRLKIPFWRDAADYYRRKLRHTWKLEEIRLKDADGALSIEQRKNDESARILSVLGSLPGIRSVCLDEHGETLTSKNLAEFILSCAEQALQPCFIIGGAYGLAPELLKSAGKTLRLSSMTFTHELAQVILWEQLYRADSILRGSGYHHASLTAV
jgi:23S rRNA (pseudouridine1915-N3)-methyltransferase